VTRLNSTQLDITDVGADCLHGEWHLLCRQSASICLTYIEQFCNSSDGFSLPDKSAVKSHLTAWCDRNLSNRAYAISASINYWISQTIPNIKILISAGKMLAQVIMKIMINQFIVIASSHCIERKIRRNCFIIRPWKLQSCHPRKRLYFRVYFRFKWNSLISVWFIF